MVYVMYAQFLSLAIQTQTAPAGVRLFVVSSYNICGAFCYDNSSYILNTLFQCDSIRWRTVPVGLQIIFDFYDNYAMFMFYAMLFRKCL